MFFLINIYLGSFLMLWFVLHFNSNGDASSGNSKLTDTSIFTWKNKSISSNFAFNSPKTSKVSIDFQFKKFSPTELEIFVVTGASQIISSKPINFGSVLTWSLNLWISCFHYLFRLWFNISCPNLRPTNTKQYRFNLN